MSFKHLLCRLGLHSFTPWMIWQGTGGFYMWGKHCHHCAEWRYIPTSVKTLHKDMNGWHEGAVG